MTPAMAANLAAPWGVYGGPMAAIDRTDRRLRACSDRVRDGCGGDSFPEAFARARRPVYFDDDLARIVRGAIAPRRLVS